MPRVFVPDSEAFQRARQAVHDGDKMAARHWALVTLRMAPDLEDAWLILAAVGTPHASIAYLERALEINPNSQRAQKGMLWARQRLAAKTHQRAIQKKQAEAVVPSQRAEIAMNEVPATVAATPMDVAMQTLPDGTGIPLEGNPIASQALPSLVKVEEPVAQLPDAPSQQVVGRKIRRLSQSRYKRTWGLLLISPWLVGLLLFNLAPLLATLGVSFTNFFLLTPNTMQFVGLKNYVDLIRDPYLYEAFLGTIKLALIVIPLQTAAAILLATLLNDEKLRLKDALRVLFFLPSIIPSVAAIFMWDGFTNPQTGWLYQLFLNPLGLAKYINFTPDNSTSILSILGILWSIGPGFLIILGAIQGIPTDIFEAAQVDGANRLRRFFSITLPMATPAIFFTLILNLTAVFGGAILLDRGSAFFSNRSSVDNYLYFLLFDTFRLGAAASLAWIFFIFLVILVLVLFATSKRWVYFPDQAN